MGDEKPGAVRFLTDFSAGSRIAGYCLEEQIGHGGTAVVFRAQDERLPRQVALKILSPTLAADDEFRHRFIRESRSAAAVDDPHIIPVYEAGDANGVLFIAMRYVPSGDAGTLVRRLGPLPIARVAAIISAVASALDAAHAAGLVHRDVKPANMLVDSRPGRPDHVYLSDFGLTKGGQASATQTGTGHFLGTPTYCAPEQIRGQAVDARGRVRAGVRGVHAAVRRAAVPTGRGAGGAVRTHVRAAARLTSRREDLPVAVDDVLMRALAKTPEDRYLTCGEFADDLRAASGLQRYDSDVAVVLHQQTLSDQRQALGPEHPDTLTTRYSLAQEMSARGEHTAAEGELRAVLAVRERMLGPEHPDTLATRFSIAKEIAARGAHTSAEDEFRIVLAARQRTLGPDHPDTLATRFSVAREMSARGRHDAAETEFRSVLAARQRTLGRDHPDTLATSFCVAQEMAARGDHGEAENGFRRVFAARQRTLGPDHPDTLATWFSVAQEMAARGDHAGAEEQFRHVLAAGMRTLGAGHPDTLIVRYSIAREMAARGDHAGAEDEFRAVLPHLESRLGLDHPVTLTLWFSIAQEMAARGDHAGAAKEFRGMLPYLSRRLGPDHPHTRAAAEQVGRTR
jgi:hypothetical protein